MQEDLFAIATLLIKYCLENTECALLNEKKKHQNLHLCSLVHIVPLPSRFLYLYDILNKKERYIKVSLKLRTLYLNRGMYSHI